MQENQQLEPEDDPFERLSGSLEGSAGAPGTPLPKQSGSFAPQLPAELLGSPPDVGSEATTQVPFMHEPPLSELSQVPPFSAQSWGVKIPVPSAAWLNS